MIRMWSNTFQIMVNKPTYCFNLTRGYKTRGEYFRNIGYEYNKVYKGGLLPRLDPKDDSIPIPMPIFKSKKSWSEKKATFGQNDYIDILGDGSVNPVDLINGPKWLVGFRGNELQRLSRQLRFEGSQIRAKNSNKFHEINKRIKYLMWRYNHKFGGLKK
ncbi:39S ribosomal mitochondrial [Brachionus plicatilis]|uniref:Large ribosomal subunit protein mL51 n=1 Tax=Brachionus plicatilis TaxID=10195 RepID=A0A3M7SFH6_BRAPC|nr:39S ribosomal mitochondrial [Brachionus plicatilis]